MESNFEPAFNPYFLVNPRNYVIGMTGSMAKSERTFDINVNDMATNKELLQALKLVAIYADGAVDYAIRFFSFYLSSFTRNGTDEVRKYLETNPVIRILVEQFDIKENVCKSLQAQSFAAYIA